MSSSGTIQATEEEFEEIRLSLERSAEERERRFALVRKIFERRPR